MAVEVDQAKRTSGQDGALIRRRAVANGQPILVIWSWQWQFETSGFRELKDGGSYKPGRETVAPQRSWNGGPHHVRYRY